MKKIGKYSVVEELGKGAMGVVYKALDPDINREVAIKTIRFDLVSEGTENEEVLKRFIKEAQSAGKLTHPNIITIYDVGREKDMTYIVMQYVEGQSLQKTITSGKKFTTQEVTQLMSQLCDALDYAHQNGIIHRDIKPGNILIDREGMPYLVDFGIARIETSTLTQSGTILGTPSYMSPEQVMGKKIDSRSDIFSLGIILYELLTGKKPFDGESITTIIYKIVNEEPTPLVKVRKNMPPGFEHLIEKALAKDPQDRYQACAELNADLHELIQLTDKTLTLKTSKEAIATSKRKKRRTWGIILAASLGGIAILAGGGYLYLTQKPKETSAPPVEIKEVKAEEPPGPTQLEVADPDSIDVKIKKVIESFENKDFTQTLQLAKEVISEQAENITAKEYLEKAEIKLNEELIANFLASGISSYKTGKFRESLKAMEKILNLDKEHKEAKEYLYLADTAISRREIRQIIERQRKAEEEKDLLTLLNDIGSSILSNQRRADAMLLFNYYDDIKSLVSNISIKFKNRNQVEVSFSHMLTAIYKKTGLRRVLFEGVKTWTMKRQGKIWKIINNK
ncbi:MAG: protein kinase [Candidatus Aminicenantaceae bacterium]